MINDELPNRIASGTIRIKPVIEKITEHGVQFTDGTRVDDVDTVSRFVELYYGIKNEIF